MELRHLRYFVAVAEELHFGRAAERLHMAQPPLSQQIKQLETELGVTLLERTTRQVSLTPAGERYLERSRAVLQSVDQANLEATRIADGQVGRVALGFIGSATYSLLPELARELREVFPRIEFDFKGEMLTPVQELGLREGSIDVGILRTPVRDPDVAVEVLRREPLVVALPSEHPLTAQESVRIKDLRDEPFVTYPGENRSVLADAVMNLAGRAGFRPRAVVQVAETSTMVVFVAAGMGVSIVPESVTDLRLSGVEFRPLADRASIDLALGWHPQRIQPAGMRVVEHLRRRFAEASGDEG